MMPTPASRHPATSRPVPCWSKRENEPRATSRVFAGDLTHVQVNRGQ